MNAAIPKIRMGFVGGGEGAFIAQAHRQAAGLDGRFELVCGAFSRDAQNNRNTGAALGLPASRCYSDWQQMLEAERGLPAEQRMELLVIVTPNHLHAPVASQALGALGLGDVADGEKDRRLGEAVHGHVQEAGEIGERAAHAEGSIRKARGSSGHC